MIDKASRIVSKSNAERECRLRAPCLYCRYKQRSDPATALVWSYAQSSVIRSTSPQQRHQQQQQRLATVYTMGFSEAQLSAHPSLVMFCKENKFQMAIVSWRSQSDSEQRHGAAVHFSSCVATCRPRVTCRPTWPRLEICTCPHPQLGSRSRTLCITFIYCAGPHYSRRDNLLDI